VAFVIDDQTRYIVDWRVSRTAHAASCWILSSGRSMIGDPLTVAARADSTDRRNTDFILPDEDLASGNPAAVQTGLAAITAQARQNSPDSHV
jgi:hypothetical protein